MAKRFADEQLTRENPRDSDSDEDQPSGIALASKDVMSRRKIAMPKRKMAFPTTLRGNNDESKVANAFSFTQKAPEGPKDEKKNDKAAKLKALNLQFKDKISEFINKDACCDLRSTFIKYGKYLDEINADSSVTAAPSTKPFTFTPQNTTENVVPGFGKVNNNIQPSVQTPKQTTFNFTPQAPTAEKKTSEPIVEKTSENAPAQKNESDSESDSDEEIKVEGPKFTLSGNTKPITSDKTFSFGVTKQQKKKEDDSDSDSDIEIKGPQFTFTGTVKSDVFKLKKSDGNSSSETKAAENIPESKDEAKEEKKPMPKFSFGSTSNPFSSTSTSATAPSSEDQKNDTASKPAFSFGSISSTTGDKKEETTTKPLQFSFSSETAKKTDTPLNKDTEENTKPSFSFGATKPNPFTSAGGFFFGKTDNTPSSSTEENNKPSFSFGATKPAEEPTDSKPSFSFMAPATKNDDAAKDDETASPESKENKKPSLSFNFSSSSEAPKSAFSFGNNLKQNSTGNDTTKPSGGFTFGQSKAPAFAFGKPSSETEEKASSTNNPPSAGFKFSLPFNNSSSNNEEKKSTENTQVAANTEDTNATETPIDDAASKQMSLQNGEEDELPLFTQRSKLMTVNTETNGYDSRGVGELKLLQRKDDKSKIRLLCRSDGMGNILLNTALVKSFKYVPLTADNENLVKIPTIDESGKLVTYVARFKQKADGRLFVKSIEDAQKDIN
ncbi:Nucleoporin NUP2 [Nakaseomyces bracarensis]|uniref:Nucleoporin NUP2 n=1 Tax=Nakaseomyces bracarensis TaxID=273131 RepID=A0ABR4NS04_9SACH